jgi:hypothetical protein
VEPAQVVRAALVVEVRVRERQRGAGGAAERDRVGQRDRAVRDVDRPAVVEVAGERVLDRRCGARGDHRAREIGAAERAVRAACEQRVDVEHDAAAGEPGGHHAHAIAAPLAQRREPGLEHLPVAAAVEREHVHGAAVVVARQLDRADRARAADCHRRAGAGVVIGEREHRDVALGGARCDLFW